MRNYSTRLAVFADGSELAMLQSLDGYETHVLAFLGGHELLVLARKQEH